MAAFYYPASTYLDNAKTEPVDPDTGLPIKLSAGDLLQMRISKGIGLPAHRTLTTCVQSQAISGVYWIEVEASLQAAVTPNLFAEELAGVVTTKPAGWHNELGYADNMPSDKPSETVVVADSIATLGSAGTSNQITGSYPWLAVEALGGPLLRPLYSNGRTGRSTRHGFTHGGVSGSQADTGTYAASHTLQFNQHYKTMSMPTSAYTVLISLGTNDLAAGDTAANVWAELDNLAGLFAAEFPLIRIVLTTLIRRSENVTLNAKIDATNTLIRAGAWEVFDLAAEHPNFHPITGDTTTSLYQPDGIHLAGGIDVARLALQPIL